jgi:hypothetical protein
MDSGVSATRAERLASDLRFVPTGKPFELRTAEPSSTGDAGGSVPDVNVGVTFPSPLSANTLASLHGGFFASKINSLVRLLAYCGSDLGRWIDRRV